MSYVSGHNHNWCELGIAKECAVFFYDSSFSGHELFVQGRSNFLSVMML